jgi:hypothetical protein
MLRRSDIVEQLNQVAADYPMGFPSLATWFPIDVRLSAYRDDSDWALVIETLIFESNGPIRHDCISTFIYCYGDSLTRVPGFRRPRLHVTSDGPSGPLFALGDITGQRIRDGASDMRIRGEIVPITTDRKVYETAGVIMRTPPEWIKKGIKWHKPSGLHGCELMRLIAPKYRRLFFATDAEIVQRIGRGMPLLLRLDEWYHVDDSNNERPSDSESYQLIAECIAKNDPSLYRPTVPPNTHWRNWPQAGII